MREVKAPSTKEAFEAYCKAMDDANAKFDKPKKKTVKKPTANADKAKKKETGIRKETIRNDRLFFRN